jgi:hypothetical protein
MIRYLIRHVMPGLVPGIHVFLQRHRKQDVDGRDKPGHDDQYRCARSAKAALRDWQDTIADRAPVQSSLGLPECGSARVSACTPPTVVCPVRIPRATGAITDALGNPVLRLKCRGGDARIGGDCDGVSGTAGARILFFAPHTARIREIGIRSGCRFTA